MASMLPAKPIKTLWCPVVQGTNADNTIADFPAKLCSALNDVARMSFACPPDWGSMIDAVIFVVSVGTTISYDMASSFGYQGEAANANSATAAPTNAITVANTIYALDASQILTSIAANDVVGVRIRLTDALNDFYVIGLRVRYI